MGGAVLSPVNVPVPGPDGAVALVLHRVEEVTELIRARGTRGSGDNTRVLEAELYTRARELQELNQRLREAHAREREVALHLQQAMLPAPDLPDHHRAAVRYRPATGSLNVCGDWYDLIDMPDRDCTAVAVGDVVGHGLHAAGVMGQLRSALSAASRVADGPAQALEALGLYARFVDGAESTTAVSVFIDWTGRTLTYSSAGHPPPVLCHPDGTVSFLDEATDPPLGARPDHEARPQSRTGFTDGSTLVLYTDGLIERRHEDIDTGLQRLADSLTRHRTADPDTLADALLTDLIPPAGITDDTALVILRLSTEWPRNSGTARVGHRGAAERRDTSQSDVTPRAGIARVRTSGKDSPAVNTGAVTEVMPGITRPRVVAAPTRSTSALILSTRRRVGASSVSASICH